MVTLKELEAYIKLKDYIEENNVKIENLLESFNTKCVHVTVESNGVSKKFYSLASAAHYMNVSLATIYIYILCPCEEERHHKENEGRNERILSKVGIKLKKFSPLIKWE